MFISCFFYKLMMKQISPFFQFDCEIFIHAFVTYVMIGTSIQFDANIQLLIEY